MQNKKTLSLGPVLYLIAGLMAAFSAISLFWDYRIAIAEFIAAVALFVLVRLEMHVYQRDLRRIQTASAKSLGSSDIYALNTFPLPCAVVTKDAEFVYYNDIFRETVLGGKDCYGSLLKSRFKGITDETLTKLSNGAEVSTDSKKFTVYGSLRRDGGYSLYFIENTTLKNIAAEYNESRPVVAVIMIDNYDELMQNAKEGEKAEIVGLIEKQLINWVAETSGFLRHSDRDKYLFVFEERHYKKIVETRFDILDRVRQIIVGEFMSATLSIGVGRGGKTFAENEELARQGIDMALGRGGDQAAVHSPSGYEFFGGVSKAVEKRTKVKTRIIASALSELIDGSDNVLIMGHRATDLDCVGAAAGLYKAAVSRGCNARIVLSRRTSLAGSLIEMLESEGYKEAFVEPDEALFLVTPKTLLIIEDTHRKGFIEYAELYKAAKTVVVIDHHRKMVDFIDNAVIFYHEPYASSTCEMVSELIQYIADKSVTVAEASALLSGITLDTRNFSVRTGVRTFEAAAYLRRKGADTARVKQLFSGSMDDYKKRARLVSSAEVYRGFAISAYTGEEMDSLRYVAPQAADELLSIEGVKASVVMYEREGKVNISARSMGAFNVQLVMEQLGGGGHLAMAGAQLSDTTVPKAVVRVKSAIDEYLNSLQQNG